MSDGNIATKEIYEFLKGQVDGEMCLISSLYLRKVLCADMRRCSELGSAIRFQWFSDRRGKIF